MKVQSTTTPGWSDRTLRYFVAPDGRPVIPLVKFVRDRGIRLRQAGSVRRGHMSHDKAGSGSDRRIGRGRIADQIVDDLRERILSGELLDGSRLPAEREFAEQYGVSSATVREAVRVLATVGLVSVRHGSGSFVTAESDTMIGMSIASVVRLEGVGATELLGVLGSLTARRSSNGARTRPRAQSCVSIAVGRAAKSGKYVS
jgi:Bacterial regulatory proteins, gntR family